MSEADPKGSPSGLSLANVTVVLGGHEILSDINLEVAPGQQVAFVGPSGAGKTTLLRLLNGTVRSRTGTVTVGGRVVQTLKGRQLRDLRRGIGFIHQDLRLVPNLRVSQNVLTGKLGGQNIFQSIGMFIKPSAAYLQEVHSLLDRVGIPDKIFQRVDQLSGGEAQRVAVARALIQKPAILVADEPVSSVDPARAREVLQLVTDICRQEGLTLCVSLHDPDLVRDFFPRVVGLRSGRIVLDTSADAMTPAQLEKLYSLGDDGGVALHLLHRYCALHRASFLSTPARLPGHRPAGGSWAGRGRNGGRLLPAAVPGGSLAG